MLQRAKSFSIAFLTIFSLLYGCAKENQIIIDDNETTKYVKLKGLGFNQSMVFSDGKALFFLPDEKELWCTIFDIKTGKKEATISLPLFSNYVPHANCACFSNSYLSSDSCFPALYISSWDGQRQVYVYDIKSIGSFYTATLSQIIDPSKVCTSIIGAGYINWVVDAENSLLYSVAYELPYGDLVEAGNSTRITWFKIPKVDDENNIVYLTDLDVGGNSVFPVMNAFQDMICSKGVIYAVAGYPYPPYFDNKYYSINPHNKSFTEKSIPLDGEPEGFCEYQGVKYVHIADGSERVYCLDKYLTQ